MATLEQVIDVIANETRLDPGALRGPSALAELGLTSFAMMRLLMRLEEEFDIEFSPDELASVPALSASGIHDIVESSITDRTT